MDDEVQARRAAEALGTRAVSVRRGVGWHVDVQAASFLENGMALVGSPVKSVRLLGVEGLLEEVLDSPFIGLLRGLDLSESRLHNLAAEKIAQAERLAKLKWLELAGNDLDDRGVEALAASRVLSLTGLGLAGNVIDDDGVRVLAAGTACSGLRELDLARVPFGDGFGMVVRAGGIAALGRLPLRRLVLRGNPVGEAGAAAFAGGFEQLRELDLADAGLGPSAAWALAAASGLAGLEVLDVSRNPLGGAGVRALCDGPFLARDLTVIVRDTGLTDEDLAPLRARFRDVLS